MFLAFYSSPMELLQRMKKEVENAQIIYRSQAYYLHNWSITHFSYLGGLKKKTEKTR